MTKSKTSSYLDLSPLYGSNQKMQDSIRTFEHGKIKADSFADKRLLGMPPGVGVILIMFNRFHNDVCDNLIAINEDGRFTAPVASERLSGENLAAAKKKYDNDLFQTARLVTTGLYINITLVDYVRNIVNVSIPLVWFHLDGFGLLGCFLFFPPFSPPFFNNSLLNMDSNRRSSTVLIRNGHWTPDRTLASTSARTRARSVARATSCRSSSTCAIDGTRASHIQTRSGSRNSTTSSLGSLPARSASRSSSGALASLSTGSPTIPPIGRSTSSSVGTTANSTTTTWSTASQTLLRT